MKLIRRENLKRETEIFKLIWRESLKTEMGIIKSMRRETLKGEKSLTEVTVLIMRENRLL